MEALTVSTPKSWEDEGWTPLKIIMEPKNHQVEKGNSSKPNLHDFGFQPFIFSEIPGIASFGEVVVKSKGKPCPPQKKICRKHLGLGIHTLPKFNSSPLKSYCTPFSKDCLPFPPFFRGELLNFRACRKILPQKFYVKKLETKTFATLTWERGRNVGFLTQRFFSGVIFLRFLQDWICHGMKITIFHHHLGKYTFRMCPTGAINQKHHFSRRRCLMTTSSGRRSTPKWWPE